MPSSSVRIRQLTTIEEMKEMQQIEEKVWKMSPIPVHQTFSALNNGGIVLGAYEEEKMIGFLYSFAGFNGRQTHLCSHMLGILPEYRQGGIGMRMKFRQMELASRMGYQMITWTYDPLESANAYLNLHKLGAKGVTYKEDYYSSMDDLLNKGVPTDRIQVKWSVNDETVKPNISFDDKRILIDIDEYGAPILTDIFSSSLPLGINEWLVAIPEKYQMLKQKDIELAKEWRYKTREVFKTLFMHGYYAVDLLRNHSKQVSYYVFSK